MLKGDEFYITYQKISSIYFDVVALYYLTSNIASREQGAMAIRAMRRKSGNCMLTKFIEVNCRVFFSVSLSKTKQNKE